MTIDMRDFNDMTKPDAAVTYAERLGWYVLPVWWSENGICACGDPTCDRKHPISALVPNGQKDASNDPEVVARWWARYPLANPAIFLKPSGLVALDVDQGKRPPDEWYAFADGVGDVPMALIARTGNVEEAYHYVFSTANLNGHQVRGHVYAPDEPGAHDTLIKHDGYIVVAPSVHQHGRQYRWLTDNLPGDPGPVITPMITTDPSAVTLTAANDGADGDPFDWSETITAMLSSDPIPWGEQELLLTSAVASVVARGISDTLAIPLLLGLLSKFANEPGKREWTAVDVADKLRRARANPLLQPDKLTAAQQAFIDNVTASGQEVDPKSLQRFLRRVQDHQGDELFRAWLRGKLVMPEAKSLKDLLAEPDEEQRYRIAGLWPFNGRVLGVAARKTGKTTVNGNVVRTLADGGRFLGCFPVEDVPGSIVLIDNEMSPTMLRRWYHDLGIVNADRVALWSLRGRGTAFDILDPAVRSEWAARLRALPGGTSALLLDCLSPALSALGLSESNEDVGRFLSAFDALLVEAEVGDALVWHHMGHIDDASRERSRGASRLRDWPEAEWRLVRERDDREREVENGARFLSAYGRDVDLAESTLEYDATTRRLTLAGGNRRQHRASQHAGVVAEIVAEDPGITATNLKTALKERTGVTHAAALVGIIREAEREGLIRVEDNGKGRPKLHHPNGGRADAAD